jgi:hypothetical protein
MFPSKERTHALRYFIIFLFVVLGATGCEVGIQPPSVEESPAQHPLRAATPLAAIQWQRPEQAIDVVFVPDDDYGDMSVVSNRQAFIDDIENMIGEGFLQNNALAVNLMGLNFWYMLRTGDVQPPAKPEDICPVVTWPDLAEADFAEVFVLLHRNTSVLRDCADKRRVTSRSDRFSAVVHEFSHGAFNLPDEYCTKTCCDSPYFAAPPVLYETLADCNNDPDNADWRDCQCFTDNKGEDWCRSEDDIDDIMSVWSNTVLEYGPADWVIVRDVLSGLGWGAPNVPMVFAPTNWDWP